jgi:hypothetical protein
MKKTQSRNLSIAPQNNNSTRLSHISGTQATLPKLKAIDALPIIDDDIPGVVPQDESITVDDQAKNHTARIATSPE